MRSGQWKYRAKNSLLNEDIYRFGAATDVEIPAALYNLRLDPAEQKSVMADHPSVTKRMEELMQRARADLGDSLTGVAPTNARPVGRIDEPKATN